MEQASLERNLKCHLLQVAWTVKRLSI